MIQQSLNILSSITAILLATGMALAGEGVECWYCARPTETTPHPELEVYENCVVRVEGRQLFSKEHLNRIRFDSHGLASALIGDQHYYIKPDGAMLAVLPFDNGPDYFSEGLTRSVVNGKMAWFNRRFDEVIPPRYDWGWPFEGGRALVCKGCFAEPSDGNGHSRITGGLWGYIDRQGEEIVPVLFTQSEIGHM